MAGQDSILDDVNHQETPMLVLVRQYLEIGVEL